MSKRLCMSPTIDQLESGTSLYWFGRGLVCVFTLPALILMGAFAGFSGLARDAGFSLAQTEFMILTVWALPSKVVLTGAVTSGSSLFATFIAVALSSVRLMPMTMAIIPEMKTDKTRGWVLYFVSHFIAVTGWVMALERFGSIPRDKRTAFFSGLVAILLLSNMIVTAITFQVAGLMSPIYSAALVFVTPLYFLFSLWGSARELSGHLAMVVGLMLTPIFHWLLPQVDILVTGIVGGALAYLVGRIRRGVSP